MVVGNPLWITYSIYTVFWFTIGMMLFSCRPLEWFEIFQIAAIATETVSSCFHEMFAVVTLFIIVF